MPILYIHGVNTRSREPFEDEIRPYLRRYLAPAISNRPESVLIEDVYWGDHGVKFAWHGASRPRSRLLGQGGGNVQATTLERALITDVLLRHLGEQWPIETKQRSTGGLVGGRPRAGEVDSAQIDLAELSPDELSDLLCGMAKLAFPATKERIPLQGLMDEVSNDPGVREKLEADRAIDKQIDLLLSELRRRTRGEQSLVGQGVQDSLARFGDSLRETFGRTKSLPAHAASVLMAEARGPLNELISVFIGDVFEYLKNRGTDADPGPIVRRLLGKLQSAHQNKLARGGEPLVVLSHSMGGQIVYDAVSHFLPADRQFADLRIDFWCATASQVGFFEEAKMFIASIPSNVPGHPVILPDTHLGVWWNVWDHNDFLSFTANGIFARVDDESFDSGMSLLAAHGGYLERPSFYRQFVAKLKAAKQREWRAEPWPG